MNIINNRPIIIGIDHGYGNIKTANCCFKTGVASFDKEPTFKSNLLVYEGRYWNTRSSPPTKWRTATTIF